MGWKPKEWQFDFEYLQEIYPFSILALGPTEPSVRWVLGKTAGT
jgi:hypothetical protein